MFGANTFGAPYFGQGYAGANSSPVVPVVYLTVVGAAAPNGQVATSGAVPLITALGG